MHRYIIYNIIHVFHSFNIFHIQNQALLDTMPLLKPSGSRGHIILHNTLAIGHTKHDGEQQVSLGPFLKSHSQGSNHRDFIFIRPPGILKGDFVLEMNNVWFCKPLLLFEIESKTVSGVKRHRCVYVLLIYEYNSRRKQVSLLHISHI